MRVLWQVLIAPILVFSVVTLGATESAIDSHDYERRGAVIQKFATAIYQARVDNSATTAVAAMRTWIDKASDEDLAAIANPISADGQSMSMLAHMISQQSEDADALDLSVLADAVESRITLLRKDASWQAMRAGIALRAGQLEQARDYAAHAQGNTDTLCGKVCAPAIVNWIATGKVSEDDLAEGTDISDLFDERSATCPGADPYSMGMAHAVSISELVLATAGTAVAARAELLQWWPKALRGCNDYADNDRLSKLLDASYTREQLHSALIGAEQSLIDSVPAALPFLGVKLRLPSNECDFALDASCTQKSRPLTVETAQRLVALLSASSDAFAPIGQCPAPPSESDKAKIERLAKAYKKDIEAAAKLGAAEGLSALREVLAKPDLALLSWQISAYGLDDALAQWAHGEFAAEALAVYQIAMTVGRMQASPSEDTQSMLALLQLRAGLSAAALLTLEAQSARQQSNTLNQSIGDLRAAIAGAELMPSVHKIERPWFSGRYGPVCSDAFNRSKVQRVDIVAALHGERSAARYELADVWPQQVSDCIDGNRWNAVLTRFRDAHSADERLALQQRAVASLRLDAEPQFELDGLTLPLPDRICEEEESCMDEDSGRSIQPEDVEALLRTSGLFGAD